MARVNFCRVVRMVSFALFVDCWTAAYCGAETALVAAVVIPFLVLLVGMAGESTNTGTGSAADQRAFQTSTKHCAEQSATRTTNGGACARADAMAVILIVAAVIVTMVIITAPAPVVGTVVELIMSTMLIIPMIVVVLLAVVRLAVILRIAVVSLGLSGAHRGCKQQCCGNC